jgi:CheY-like chemotaxis protein
MTERNAAPGRARAPAGKPCDSRELMDERRPPVVLVVDDNSANRALAQATLEDEGYRVLLAASGEDAIAVFLRDQPDCGLLDIQMAGMDGVTACRRIRELPGGAAMPILFLTAQRDLDTFDRAQLAGGDDFLTRPVRPTQLVLRIEAAMKLHRIPIERNGRQRSTTRSATPRPRPGSGSPAPPTAPASSSGSPTPAPAFPLPCAIACSSASSRATPARAAAAASAWRSASSRSRPRAARSGSRTPPRARCSASGSMPRRSARLSPARGGTGRRRRCSPRRGRGRSRG